MRTGYLVLAAALMWSGAPAEARLSAADLALRALRSREIGLVCISVRPGGTDATASERALLDDRLEHAVALLNASGEKIDLDAIRIRVGEEVGGIIWMQKPQCDPSFAKARRDYASAVQALEQRNQSGLGRAPAPPSSGATLPNFPRN